MNIKLINPQKGLKTVPERKHPRDISYYGYLYLSLNYGMEHLSKNCPEGKKSPSIDRLFTQQLDLHLK